MTEPEQYSAFSDGGSLYAFWTRDSPSPYLSKIQRFDAGARVWQTVFEDDARVGVWKPSAGRLAFVEYREPFQGGGASDQKVLILDLVTGKTVSVDTFALSAATYHGGGGGPRRAGSGVALGGGTVAWTRVNELSGGNTEGELRVAPVDDPTHFRTIGRSQVWIEPLWIDSGMLLYLVGSTTGDEIRARDLTSGVERRITSLAAPGVGAPRGELGRSGDIIGWTGQESVQGAPTMLHTVNTTTGASRDLDLGPDYCYGLSGNAAGFVWACKTSSAPVSSLSYFDPRAWKSVDIVRSPDRLNQLEAYENAFLWYDVVNGARRANLLVLR